MICCENTSRIIDFEDTMNNIPCYKSPVEPHEEKASPFYDFKIKNCEGYKVSNGTKLEPKFDQTVAQNHLISQLQARDGEFLSIMCDNNLGCNIFYQGISLAKISTI